MRHLTRAVAALLLAGVAPLGAQDHPNTARGFAADKAFHVGDIDHVSAYNGNLVLTCPWQRSRMRSTAA